MDPAAANVGI